MNKIRKYFSKFVVFFFISTLFILTSLPSISQSADKPLQIDIMGGNIQAMPIAISYFSTEENLKELNLHKNIPNLIANNLINSGLFKLLDRDAYMQNPDQLNARPKFRDWRIIDAQALISGKIIKKTEDKLSVSVELWDVYGEKRMFGLSLSSKIKSWRRISHIISDKIYERLTGEEGYFDTRIVYISESGSQKNKIKRLAIMDQDGGNHKYLTDGKSLVLTPRFSPNQQQITFFSYNGIKAGLKPSIYLYNLLSGKIEILGQFPGMSFAPRFSPDGLDLVMSLAQNGTTNIHIMNLKSKKN